MNEQRTRKDTRPTGNTAAWGAVISMMLGVFALAAAALASQEAG